MGIAFILSFELPGGHEKMIGGANPITPDPLYPSYALLVISQSIFNSQ